MRAILKKLLRAYRPYDAKFRYNSIYRKFSEQLYFWVRPLISTKKGGGHLSQVAYVRGLGSIDVEENTYLFESYWGKKVSDHPLAVFRELVKEPNFRSLKIFWTVAAGVKPPHEITKHSNVECVDPSKFAYGEALLKAKYLVNNVTFPPFFIRQEKQVYCNTWHGVPMKAMGRDMNARLISMANTQRNYLQASILPVSSSYYVEKAIRPYYVADITAGKLLEMGSARVDDILSPKIPETQIRQKYGIGSNQKIVLFALTWRGNSTNIIDVFSEQVELFKSIAKQIGPEFHVLFSAHQMTRMRETDLPENGSILDGAGNINDILPYVSVLVSDYSSIIFDFLPLDRKTILYVPDVDQYRDERGLYIEPSDLCCEVALTQSELYEKVVRGKAPSEFDNYAQCRAKYFPHEKGNSAKAALDYLTEKNKLIGVDGRKRARILFAPGGMMPNGITSSLKSLISNLDYSKYDPYVVIDAAVMDKDSQRQEQYFEFDQRCNWILRCGEMLHKPGEKEIYDRYRKGDIDLNDTDMIKVKEIFTRESRRIFGDAKFDVAIEFGGYSPYWTGVVAGAQANSRVIYQHNHLWAEACNPNPNRNQKQLISIFKAYKWFDEIVAVSDETKNVNFEYLSKFYKAGVTPRTVRNAINVSKIRRNAETPLALTNQQASVILSEPGIHAFVALGRLSPEKRYDRMINAFARVVKYNNKAVLLICGKGPLQKELQTQILRMNLSSNIFLLGQVSNPHALLANSDGLLMTSDYEGQPMVLLEALTIGARCFGTDIPGIRSVLKDDLGYLMPLSEAAIADVLLRHIDGKLPPLKDSDIDGYVNQTMQEFYQIIS